MIAILAIVTFVTFIVVTDKGDSVESRPWNMTAQTFKVKKDGTLEVKGVSDPMAELVIPNIDSRLCSV